MGILFSFFTLAFIIGFFFIGNKFFVFDGAPAFIYMNANEKVAFFPVGNPGLSDYGVNNIGSSGEIGFYIRHFLAKHGIHFEGNGHDNVFFMRVNP